MRKARVLIVDDAAVVRRILSDVLAEDPQIEVAGTAANGRIALQRIEQLKPDIVTLDIEMPEMDGLQTLAALRKDHPKLPVIMFSTLTARGAISTLDALALGATDYVTKPANVGSVVAAMQSVRDELIPKIKCFCDWLGVAARPKISARPIVTAASSAGFRPRGAQPLGIVAIGISTGGPNALAELFTHLPAAFPVPIVIVQHMPPIFTQYLADRLTKISNLKVVEAKHGDVLHAGGAWIAPGDFHLTLARRENAVVVHTSQGPPENSCRPAADPLFRSVAEVYGSKALAVVMTGMGCDGKLGCEQIHAAGGRIIAQDEATSVVWGMPGAVVEAGIADEIVPLGKLPERMTTAAMLGRSASAPLATATASAARQSSFVSN